ncbi:hypothetical protein OROMI_009137 [Orobanche minor]
MVELFRLDASKAYQVGSPQSILNLYASNFEEIREDEKSTIIIVKPKTLSALSVADISAHMGCSDRDGMQHLLGEQDAYIFRFVFPTEIEVGHVLEKVPKFEPTYNRQKDTLLKGVPCTKIKSAHVYMDFASKLIPLLVSMHEVP